MTNVGQRIHDLRVARGMTLEQVGALCGVGRSTVYKWETGDIENMRRDKIALLAKALGVDPLFLMGWAEEPKEPKKDDVDAIRRELHDNPDLLTLLDLGRGCSKAEMKQIIAIVKAYKGDYND